MREFFDNIPLNNEENISEEQLQKIKASVLSRVKEEKAMSKRSTIKTITIAVAAATTAALSAMIASAEQPGWTVATENVDYTVDDAAEVSAVTVDNNIDEAKADEKVNDWTVSSDGSDLAIIQILQPADDTDGCYYYFKLSDEQLEEMLNNGWTLLHEYEVPADE